jgi:hypothetical protein
MKYLASLVAPLILASWPLTLRAEVVFKGRLMAPRYPGSSETVPMTAVYCFASLAGPGGQAVGFRTFEMAPAGWYFLPGSAGRYSIVFSDPAGFMRPIVLTNQFVTAGDVLDRVLSPTFDYADFYEAAWDEKPAGGYYQTFVAKGTSITSVGFKLATDGVDGPGPKAQNLVVSIHKKGKGTPDTWEQVGPTGVVLDVDCGGAKNYWWCAGWDSEQVATKPGEIYAVRLQAESQAGSFQAFWRSSNEESDCFRVDRDGSGEWCGRKLCMAVNSDCDGLLIPYNKKVQKKFHLFAGFDKSWSQTYVAQGSSIASVILYAATSGVQPSIMRQRLKVRVRKGGPGGQTVGVEKIAVGNGNYTGDASWGVFGVSFAPGEAPVEPGKMYAVGFESIENYNTLHGYVNIKGQVSDDRPGFNPYRKVAPDDYKQGTAYRACRDRQDFDLDMQIIEYQHGAENWEKAIEAENLIKNGDMEAGPAKASAPNGGVVPSWKAYSIDPGTTHRCVSDGTDRDNHVARVVGGSATGKAVDGGYVQHVGSLSKMQTYRLSGKVRSTWPVDDKHCCMVGYDPTGQDDDPRADTIRWVVLPVLHGVFVGYESDPIRPVEDAISVWLRGRTTLTQDYRFEADSDDFALHRVSTGAPTKRQSCASASIEE